MRGQTNQEAQQGRVKEKVQKNLNLPHKVRLAQTLGEGGL
jgi:hypothetical protein